MNADTQTLGERYQPKPLTVIKADRQVCRVRFTPDGRQLIGGSYDAAIRRWDFTAEKPVEIAPLQGHNGWVQDFVFHPDREAGRMFSADSWGRICCWPYAEERPQPLWTSATAHDGWIRSLAISGDGELLASGARDRRVRLWSTADGKLQQELEGHPHEVYCVAFHPDGRTLASSDLMGTVKHWDLESGRCVREIDVGEMYFYDRIQDVCGLRILKFEDGGRTLLCGGAEPTRAGRSYGYPTLRLYDWESGEVSQVLKQGETKDGYVFDVLRHPEEGFYMLATSGTPGSGRLYFRRREDAEPFLAYSEKISNCHSLAWHPEKPLLVVAATNRRSQGNGAVLDDEGNYLGNFSPLHVLGFPGLEGGEEAA